jgi:hypothetical protein
MKPLCTVLITGGKDSSLSALMLSHYFEVETVNCNFGILDSWRAAEEVAGKLGFPFRVVKLEMGVMNGAVEIILKDGFPKNGITHIHGNALIAAARETGAKIVADGTRRDDRSPILTISEILSIEMKNGIQYVRPLAGLGRKTIDLLVERFFEIEESENTKSSDYEREIRAFIKDRLGEEKIDKIFPKHHEHSRVLGVKTSYSEQKGKTLKSIK